MVLTLYQMSYQMHILVATDCLAKSVFLYFRQKQQFSVFWKHSKIEFEVLTLNEHLN